MRSALNFTVQSVASDINLFAAIDTHEWIQKSGIRAEIFGLVHDSIIGIVHKNDMEVFKNKLKEFTQMNRDGVMIPNVPIGVDFEYGDSYGTAK
jgi:DNA polymerase I-like protein with 3'-5' exonuclease and polymerase domains